MKSLQSFGLSAQLYSLVAILIGFTLFIGFSTLDGMQQMNDAIGRVYKQRVEPLQSLKMVADKYAVDIVDATHKARNGNITWKEAEAGVNAANDVINQRWEAFKSSSLTAEEKRLVDEATPMLAEANAATARLLRILQSGDEERLVTFTRKTLYQAIDPISTKFSQLIDVQLDHAKREYERSTQTFAVQQQHANILMGASVAVGLLLAFFIIRRMTGRLGTTPNKARDIANRIANDDLTFELDTSGAAQGSLLAALGRMRDSLLAMRLNFKGQIDAIHKVQVVVEFSPDGKIIAANDNFLRAFGYTHDEVLGQHHSLFCPETFRSSTSYRRFWDSLAAGQHHSGQFERVGKGQKQVWIQATYNPIRGADGTVTKVVKLASDITDQVNETRMNAAFKGALDNVTANVMVADNDGRIVYLNESARTLMSSNEQEFRKALPQFDAARIVGANMDIFHRNPAGPRNILSTITSTHTLRVPIAGRTMQIKVNPMLAADNQRLGSVVEWVDLTQELDIQKEMSNIVEQIISGRLDLSVETAGKTGFFLELSKGINTLVDSVRDIVSSVKASATEVARGAEEISQGNLDLSQRTEEQAASLEKTAAAMEEMTSTVRQNADNAGQASQLAIAARDQAERGGDVVGRAVEAMSEINASSRKIADIIGVIDEIAFQTNLLALNAAVEAARAGEQGRGFAVVASEVRNLASRSSSAAKEIKKLIEDSVVRVEEGSQLVTESGNSLQQIVTSVKRVSDIVAEIAAAGIEQSAGIDQVNKAVMQLDELTQQNAALVEEASAASQSMAEQASTLSGTMNKFSLGGEPARFATSDGNRTSIKERALERHRPARRQAAAVAPAAAYNRVAEADDQNWEEF